MYKSDGGSPIPLPEELNRALRRASERTLSALTSLRRAVLQHVQSERERGATLAEIKVDLQQVISRVHAVADGSDGDGNGDGQRELAAQVIKWTDGFYNRKD